MKLLDPSFGLYPRKTGAWVFSFTHCFSAFYVLAKYIDQRVIRIENGLGRIGSRTPLEAIVLFGLIFNFILQIVLIRGVIKKGMILVNILWARMKKFTVCRAWLLFGISGAVVWTFSVYEMSCGICVDEPMSKTCITLAIISIIYQCYVYYVILAFTVSLGPPRNREVPLNVNVNTGGAAGQTMAERYNLVLDGNNNVVDLPPPYPGGTEVPDPKMGNTSQIQAGTRCLPMGNPSLNLTIQEFLSQHSQSFERWPKRTITNAENVEKSLIRPDFHRIINSSMKRM